MSDRPISFSAPMVLALLDGRKTQTRRVLKDGPDGYWHVDPNPRGEGLAWVAPEGAPSIPIKLPYGPGDRLWVREAWADDAEAQFEPQKRGTYYRADPDAEDIAEGNRSCGIPHDWRPSIHMARWRSRLTLTVTDVRVQRLHEISEADARAEGTGLYVPGHGFITESDLHADPGYSNFLAPRMGFEAIWSEIYGPNAWDQNPWVVALTFDVHRCNIDHMERPQ